MFNLRTTKPPSYEPLEDNCYSSQLQSLGEVSPRWLFNEIHKLKHDIHSTFDHIMMQEMRISYDVVSPAQQQLQETFETLKQKIFEQIDLKIIEAKTELETKVRELSKQYELPS
jgi:hypothetical protein